MGTRERKGGAMGKEQVEGDGDVVGGNCGGGTER